MARAAGLFAIVLLAATLCAPVAARRAMHSMRARARAHAEPEASAPASWPDSGEQLSTTAFPGQSGGYILPDSFTMLGSDPATQRYGFGDNSMGGPGFSDRFVDRWVHPDPSVRQVAPLEPAVQPVNEPTAPNDGYVRTPYEQN